MREEKDNNKIVIRLPIKKMFFFIIIKEFVVVDFHYTRGIASRLVCHVILAYFNCSY